MSEEENLTCDNCTLKIAPQNYVMHTLHCARHLELCKKCGESVPKEKMEEHQDTEHAVENCAACNKTVEKELLQEHVKYECPKRLITCLYCELELPSNDMIAHTDYCGTRTEKCMECGEFVMLKYTQLHLDSNHKFLKLKDEPGPSASWETNVAIVRKVKALRISPENGESTLLPCEFCDGMFTPRELRRHQVSCTHGWNTTVPVLRRMSVIQCQVCGKSIASREFEAHGIVCTSSLPDRLNVVNGGVIPCDICDTTVPIEDYATHHDSCSKYPSSGASNVKQPTSGCRKNSVIPCDICHKPTAFEDYQRHRIFCIHPVTGSPLRDSHPQPIINTVSKLPCEFCEESFSEDELAAHQVCCSPAGKQSSIPCEFCGELKPLSEVLSHQFQCRMSHDV